MIEQDCSYSRLTLISAQPVPPLAELPITWALADPKIDERHVLIAAPEHESAPTAHRPGLTIIADKGYVSRDLDT